jgi:hypothetical protein
VAEPVAWFLIEQRWSVAGSDGEELGKVEEVLGDTGHDIFSGLVVSAGLLHRPRYLPAELVSEIVEGRVALSIGKDEFERLEEYEAPPPD